MDFGFGRFLEMFEDRFGRHVTTALLAVIGLGVLSVCLNFIVEIFVTVAGLINGLDRPSFTAWMAESFVPTFVSVAILYVGLTLLTGVVMTLYDRTIGNRRREKRIRASVDVHFAAAKEEAKAEAKKFADQHIEASVTEFYELARSELDEIKNTLSQEIDAKYDVLAKAAVDLDEAKISTLEVIREIKDWLADPKYVNPEEFDKMAKSLKEARAQGKLEEFIKEHEEDAEGDLDKLDEVLKRPVQGTASATPKSSSKGSSDD